MKSELNHRITICFVVAAIFLFSIPVLVAAQVQSGPLELKIAAQGGITYTIHLNYEISGATITKSQEDPDPFNHHYYDRKIEGVVDSDKIRIRATATIDQASETWMTWAAVVVDGKIMQESKLGKSGVDNLDVTVPVLPERTYDVGIQLHIYPNSDYWVSVTGPLKYIPTTIEKKGEPQTQAIVPEIDESCPGKCIDSGARFSSFSNEVEVQHCWDADSIDFAHQHTVLCVGDHIITGEDSNAIITFSDLSSLMVKPEADIVIAAPPGKAGKLEIIYGRLKGNILRVLSGDPIEIRSNLATVGIKGTIIVCEVTGSASTLKVLRGAASFRSNVTGEEILVGAGKMATATENGLSPIQSFDVDAENASWEEFAPKPEGTGSDTGTSKVIFNNWNTGSVDNSPSCAPSFTLSEPQMITYIDTYHWNYGSGTNAGGTVVLRDHDGKEYGPWQVETKSGQGGVPNAWWIAHPNEVIPAGDYGVVDSEQSTWSQNVESGGCGFSKVEGYPVKDISKQKQQPAGVTGESIAISTGGQKEVGASGLVATKDNPEDAEGWYTKGYNLARLGKYDEAIKAYDEAIKLAPKYVNAWYAKGINLNNLGRYDEAIVAYEEAIRLDPKYENAWYAKGVNLKKLERYDEAIKAYDEAIRLDPKDAKAWCAKGNALDMQGKYDAAIENYDEAIRLDPQSANAWYAKGNALSDLSRYDAAINAYEEAIRLDPQDANARYAKGVDLKKQGKYDEAINAYDEAIRLDPKYANALYAKGNALKLLGRTTEADAAYAKARELGYTD